MVDPEEVPPETVNVHVNVNVPVPVPVPVPVRSGSAPNGAP